jgi:hypothetical protein
MQAIVTSLSPTCGCAYALRHREGLQSNRLTQVQAETHTSADITLVTAEGDKVTLSTDTLLQAAYPRYDARGRLRGHRTEEHTETLQLSSTDDISLHIEGDLNDAECADIQQALDTFEQFATDFFNGEVDEPPNQVFDLDDLNTLHSIDTTLEFSQSLSVSQQTETRVVNAAHLGLEPNTAALEAQPSITQHPKDLLSAILSAIETPRIDVAQSPAPGEASASL